MRLCSRDNLALGMAVPLASARGDLTLGIAGPLARGHAARAAGRFTDVIYLEERESNEQHIHLQARGARYRVAQAGHFGFKVHLVPATVV